ncbi:MAG: SDR family oxidoreductase [Acidobacteriota bacterium]|jgi:NAD(P)-dependent dehydrogenase (short-subunit alcohol dehydrogenase family)|nr:SDR family oxidoreductase [Acidobacteriota bacterium]
MRLEGKTALITGGSRGIGKAIAKKFVEEGAKIVVSDILKDELEKTVAELNALKSGAAAASVSDVTNFEDVQRSVAETVKFGGKIDILVNNAGIDPGGSIVDIPIAQWKKILDVNLNGPFYHMRAAIPEMIKQGGGSIVNIASLAAVRCLPSMPAYCSSKGGLLQLSAQCALEYGPQKIRSNVVAPGATTTEMLVNAMRSLTEALKKQGVDKTGFDVMTESVPLRRPAAPEEMTGAVAFLASDEASFINGAFLLVDGGAALVDVSGASVAKAGVGWGV